MARDATTGWAMVRALLAPHRGRVITLGALSFVGGLVEAVLLVLVARLALALTDGTDVVSLGPVTSAEVSVRVLLGVAVVLPLVRLVFTAVVAWKTADLTTQVMAETRLRLLRAFLDASWSTQSRERLGQLQELLTTSAYQVLLALRSTTMGLEAALVLTALLVAALVVNLAGSLAVGAAVLVLTVALHPLRADVQRRSREAAAASRAFATSLTEHSTMAREIRVFGVEEPVAGLVGRFVDEHRRTLRRSLLAEQLAPGMYQSLALLLVALTLVFIRAADVADLAAFAAVVLLMVRSLSYGQTLQAAIQSVHQATPHLEVLEEHTAALLAAGVDRSGVAVDAIGELAFDGVTFGYEAGRPVLTDITFRTRRGELIGIVGPSGSGKSTLVQLLLRLRVPDEGTITADGRPVAEVSLASWYHRMGLAPQEPVLLTGTVAENIAFFRRTDRSALERAARLAQVHDDIVGWPEGYDTPVGERGTELSGGQRQRLCLARALVDDPDVLVFDEPTSALDARSEAAFRQVIDERSSHAIVFVVAHRLSTLRTCDRIMVVRDGGIEAFDDPAVLESSNPFFREVLRHADLRST